MSNKNKNLIPLIFISIFIACIIGLICFISYSYSTGKIHLKSDIHTTAAKTATVKQVIASKDTLKYKLDNGETLYDDGLNDKSPFGVSRRSHNIIENRTQIRTIQPDDEITYNIKHVKHNDQIFTFDETLPRNGDVYIITNVISN